MTTPTAPDQVVRLLATDGYDVHRLIYEAFVTAGGRDFLYAPFAGGGGLHAVFVRRFDVQTRFAAGMQFAMTLRAMPAVKANGRRRSIGAARAKDGLGLGCAGSRPAPASTASRCWQPSGCALSACASRRRSGHSSFARTASMNHQPPPLITVPLDLSDEAAARLIDFLLEIAHRMENHYPEQLYRYHNAIGE